MRKIFPDFIKNLLTEIGHRVYNPIPSVGLVVGKPQLTNDDEKSILILLSGARKSRPPSSVSSSRVFPPLSDSLFESSSRPHTGMGYSRSETCGARLRAMLRLTAAADRKTPPPSEKENDCSLNGASRRPFLKSARIRVVFGLLPTNRLGGTRHSGNSGFPSLFHFMADQEGKACLGTYFFLGGSFCFLLCLFVLLILSFGLLNRIKLMISDPQFDRVLSQVVFEAPRWPGGPRICSASNLPAFDSEAACLVFHEANAPGTHTGKPYQCARCGLWHYESTARGPAGESSGQSRYSKRKNK